MKTLREIPTTTWNRVLAVSLILCLCVLVWMVWLGNIVLAGVASRNYLVKCLSADVCPSDQKLDELILAKREKVDHAPTPSTPKATPEPKSTP